MAEKNDENDMCIITLRNKTVAHTFLPSTKQMAVSVKEDC